ncbi:MAG TPA: excinuclease ABC subunit UvrA [Myxococcota bacterium]|nr:excinuclease ABC subunit UvrA [Myxococcota bacterium]
MNGAVDAAPREIAIRGAREHNLRGIDVRLPRDKLVVITGLSGSGKSSLAFDTLYAEGQRRYVESLSAYARQFLDQLAKPDVESIEGLSPAISIEQRTASRNPRSTVGTVTEIHDHLRLLFARVGQPHCWICGSPIASQTAQQIVDRVLALPEGSRVQVLAPVVRGRKGEYRKELEAFRKQGFARVRIDGSTLELGDEIRLARQAKHDIDLVIDRIAVRPTARARLAESVESALRLAEGLVTIDVGPGREEWPLSEANACARCDVSFPEITPRLFSFNGPQGACPRCNGLGTRDEFDPERIVPDPERPLARAIEPWGASAQRARAASRRRAKSMRTSRGYYTELLTALASHFGVSLETPWRELPEAVRRGILHGTADEVSFTLQRGGRSQRLSRAWDGVIGELERRREASGEELLRFTRPLPCPECGGSRLRREARAVAVGGMGLDALGRLSIAALADFLDRLELPEAQRRIAERIVREIRERLGFLLDVGLDYLTLERGTTTLSGGEGQRIRLATQVGTSLLGVLYVLDEPSIGLHPRDNRRLLASLERLRDQGNSVIVVEHDEETIRSADWVVDMGPGAGVHGGALVAEGPPEAIAASADSLTGAYLAGRRRIEPPAARRAPGDRWLVLRGCSEHNLQHVDLRVPLGLFTVVTGVSGSGKSTLVNDTLHRVLAQRLHGAEQPPGRFESIEGLEQIDKVIDVDQSPIGRTPRSNPATYTGAFDGIRRIFSQVPEARVRGYGPGRFSFNVKGGRCEACRGDGILRVEMHFLPDVFVGCEVCRGRRYNRETLEIAYRGKTIADVLDLSVEEAVGFFERFESVQRPLRTLHEVGLDYLRLGQAATTLSGGEAQRIKLSRELARQGTGRTVYILDEPTTGLHFADVERLLGVLQRLAALGNTVIVIEHHMDVVKSADWVIDLGPEGGEAGGTIVAEGPPERVALEVTSHTGRVLRAALAR